MIKWAFIGGFMAVALGIVIGILILRGKVRNFSQRVFGTPRISDVLSEVDQMVDDHPRSLSAMDNLLLPKILRDFPDFDIHLAKSYLRNFIKKKLRTKQDLTIHRVAISQYLISESQRIIIFQAAVSFQENGKKLQNRYDVHYAHILSSSEASVAANCPNCGGALGYGVTDCPYCGSRVANVLGNTWKFIEMNES